MHITDDLVRWVRGHGNDGQMLSPENLVGWVASGEGGSPAAYVKWVLVATGGFDDVVGVGDMLVYG